MRCVIRASGRRSSTVGTIVAVALSFVTPAGCASTPSKQLQAEVSAQFSLWLATISTKCGSSYFTKSHDYDFVYEFVDPTLTFYGMSQDVDTLNHITTVTIQAGFSASKSRRFVRRGIGLWDSGLRGFGGDLDDADLTFTRNNSDWHIEPGGWYSEQRYEPIACDQLPPSMMDPPMQAVTTKPTEPHQKHANSPTPPR